MQMFYALKIKYDINYIYNLLIENKGKHFWKKHV